METVQHTFPQGVEPYAQITMLDAGEGDSNVVDLCLAPLTADGSYDKSSGGGRAYRRFLIDTGKRSDARLENIKGVLKNFKQPLVVKNDGGTDDPGKPFVDMFQITHTDADHCGEAVNLIKALETEEDLREYFHFTWLAFHDMPTLDPNLGLRISDDASGKCIELTSAADHVQIFRGASNQYDVPTVDPTRENATRWFTLLEDSGYRFRSNFTARHAPSNTDLGPYLSYAQFNRMAEIRLRYDAAEGLGILTEPDEDGERSTTITIDCEIKLERQRKKGNAMTYQNVLPTSDELRNRLRVTAQFEMAWMANPSADFEGYFRLPPENQVTKRPRLMPVDDSPYVLIKHAMNEVSGLTSIGPDGSTRRAVIRPDGGVPLQGYSDWFNGTTGTAEMVIIGPSEKLYQRFVSESIALGYDKKQHDEHSKITNQASIVTMFRRYTPTLNPDIPDLDGYKPLFSALFTGDAYDRECHLRDSLEAFLGAGTDRYTSGHVLDLMKVPHHGSAITASSEFYTLIRARVYLICSRQSNHGLPSLSVLDAIAEGFGSMTRPVPGHPPKYYMFFSDPGSLAAPAPRMTSNVVHLLSGKFKPNRDAAHGPWYDYVCYRLPAGTPTCDSAASILLGRRPDGSLLVDPKGGWVEMPAM